MSIDNSRPKKAKRSSSMMTGLMSGAIFSAIFNHGSMVGGE
jgi:hypothetical protein